MSYALTLAASQIILQSHWRPFQFLHNPFRMDQELKKRTTDMLQECRRLRGFDLSMFSPVIDDGIVSLVLIENIFKLAGVDFHPGQTWDNYCLNHLYIDPILTNNQTLNDNLYHLNNVVFGM